jgi:MFS family permease
LFLQQVRNFGPFDTGLVMMSQALAAAAFMPIGGRLFDKVGVRPLVVAGLGLVTIGTYMLTRISGTTAGTDLVFPLVLRGAGMALMMMPLSTHILNAAPRALVSRVTSLTTALQMVVNSLAVAGLSTILSSRPAFHTAAADVNALQAKAQSAAAHAHAAQPPVFHLPTPIADLYAGAFSDTLLVATVITLAGVVLGFTLRRNLAAQAAAAPVENSTQAPALEMAG